MYHGFNIMWPIYLNRKLSIGNEVKSDQFQWIRNEEQKCLLFSESAPKKDLWLILSHLFLCDLPLLSNERYATSNS